jgi:hypothetical protein
MDRSQRRLSKSAEELGLRLALLTDVPEQDGAALAQTTGLPEIPSGKLSKPLIGRRPDGLWSRSRPPARETPAPQAGHGHRG